MYPQSMFGANIRKISKIFRRKFSIFTTGKNQNIPWACLGNVINVRFTVQADGLKTDCAGDNANCPANAECATTGVCNCNAGWKHDGGGLCTGKDYILRQNVSGK